MAFEFLDDIPLLAELGEQQLARLVVGAVRKQTARHGVVQLEGQPVAACGIVIRGEARATLMQSDGKEILLEILRPGGFFGELSIAGLTTAPYSVAAAKRTEFLLIPMRNWTSLLNESHAFAVRLTGILADRLQIAQNRLRDSVYERADGLVLKFVRDSARQQGEPRGADRYLADVPTHQTIADACGLARETVTRQLARLHRKGVVKKHREGWLVRSAD